MIALEVCGALGARARRRRPPPRREARERDDPQGRAAQADGLRHRADAGPAADDRDRAAARLAGVHGARASSRASSSTSAPTCSRSASCCTCWRPASLPFYGQEPARGAAPDHRGEVRRSAHGRPRRRPGAVAHHHAARWRGGPRTATPTSGRWPTTCAPTWRTPGLADVRAELRAFFADPDAYEAALPKRLAAALTAAAPRHLAAKRSRQGAGALEPGARVRSRQRGGGARRCAGWRAARA